MAALEALGTASLEGSPGQHGSIHCHAAPLEAFSTGTGSDAHSMLWEQAAGGWSGLRQLGNTT